MDEKRLIMFGGALFALIASCVGCGGLFALGLHLSGDNPVAEPASGDPFEPIAPPGDPTAPRPADPASAREMRARYRPGPHVEVEGMLPSGRLAVQRIEHGARDGRTVDTPWIVGGAELRPTAAPDASEASVARPSLVHGDGDGGRELTILAGVPARLPIRAIAGTGEDVEVRGLYVAFHDYPGHFFLPATVDTELGQIQVAGVDAAEVVFGLDAAIGPDGDAITGAPETVTMYVAAVDVEGRVSSYLTRVLRVMPVGTGDVEVTVTMSRSTDIDLYVIDPTGNTVYYGNTHSDGGGQLDLDANAACSSNMGVDNEHIFWPAGAAPAGTYTVRVAHFESCIGDAPVDYRVTVENCGETVVLAGRFEGPANTETCDSMPHDDPSWCQEVVEFEVTPCEAGVSAAGPSGPGRPSGPSGSIGSPGRIL